jgi:hypothetical protein
MPARLTPKWRVIVRIKMGGSWYSFTEANTEGEHRSACHRSVWSVPGRCGLRLTGRRVGDDDSSRPAQDSCSLGLAGPYASN